MLFRQVFKARKAKQFNYTPLYYDKKKEEREKRAGSIKFKRHQYFSNLKDTEGKPSVLSGKVQSERSFRNNTTTKYRRYALFLGLMGIITAFVKLDLDWKYALAGFFILLVLLIREVNKL